MLTILGPTASGKTAFATRLAIDIDAEIISADSRQVFRGMDIGTGKDLADYTIDGLTVPHHLIDIAQPGEPYNLFRFKQDCQAALRDIEQRGRQAILCGGTGMYIEAVLRDFDLRPVPYDPQLRQRLQGMTLPQLRALLASYKTLHNTTDTDTVPRAIRAIEIAVAQQHTEPQQESPANRGGLPVIGLALPREQRRQRITRRLNQRLEQGLVEEVERLLDQGISTDTLLRYGLEYKFVTLHLLGQLTYEQMRLRLETAIHQFAKRQMTWFRGMERRGIPIHWIDALAPIEENVARVKQLLPSE